MQKKKDRKLKRRSRQQQLVRLDKKKRDQFDDMLRHAELTDHFRRLAPKLQQTMRRAVFPMPKVVVAESARNLPAASELRQRFIDLMRAPSSCPDTNMTPRQWLCIFSALYQRMENLTAYLRENGDDEHQHPWCDVFALTAAMRKFAEEKGNKMSSWFTAEVHDYVLRKSIMDERIFWYRVENTITKQAKLVRQIVLEQSAPKTTSIVVDGKSRPAFRCSIFWKPAGVTEVAWPRSELGVQFGPDNYPVYMQRHVLKQLEQRVPQATPVSITLSLGSPKFVKQSGDSILLEYRFLGRKLGYFAGNVLADKVLLKTFLFLTMQGTPESDLLYKKLHLTRQDIEYLHLDELSPFMSPDVRQDAQLAEAFRECGCGHLLEIDVDLIGQELHHGDADVLKKYLSTVDLLPPPSADRRD